MPGACPKSASSTTNPNRLDGNDDAVGEDIVQSAKAESPPPSLRTAFQQHSSGRWLDNQDVTQQDDHQRNIREITRVLAEMVTVQQAMQQEMKEMTEAISVLIGKLTVNQDADVAEDGSKDEGEKKPKDVRDDEVKVTRKGVNTDWLKEDEKNPHRTSCYD